jgi:hypothetical protein
MCKINFEEGGGLKLSPLSAKVVKNQTIILNRLNRIFIKFKLKLIIGRRYANEISERG